MVTVDIYYRGFVDMVKHYKTASTRILLENHQALEKKFKDKGLTIGKFINKNLMDELNNGENPNRPELAKGEGIHTIDNKGKLTPKPEPATPEPGKDFWPFW